VRRKAPRTGVHDLRHPSTASRCSTAPRTATALEGWSPLLALANIQQVDARNRRWQAQRRTPRVGTRRPTARIVLEGHRGHKGACTENLGAARGRGSRESRTAARLSPYRLSPLAHSSGPGADPRAQSAGRRCVGAAGLRVARRPLQEALAQSGAASKSRRLASAVFQASPALPAQVGCAPWILLERRRTRGMSMPGPSAAAP
jgi:hypothetical protein